MDIERNLISKIIAERDVTDVVDAGITPQFFLDPTARRVYSTILKHKSDYSEIPTVGVMRRDFPDYKFVKPEVSLRYLVDEVRKSYALALLEDALSSAVDAYDQEDEKTVQEILHQALGKIANDLPNTRDTDLTKTTKERLERYKALSALDGALRGISSGFDSIDKATQGFQPQQLVTYVGPPKAGKSTIMLLAALRAHAKGFSPLLIGFEMSNEEQAERLDAIMAQISHHRLRSGSLTPQEKVKLERSLHSMESMKPFVLSNDSMSTTTLTGVASKVERYKPDIVFVDGVYMMDDENGETKGSPQALTNITRGFKRMAQNLQVPVVITTQVLEWKMDRKKGITSSAIGYSSSFAQDSDVIIGVEKTDDPTINKIKIVMARNAPPTETYVEWDWETGLFEERADDPFASQEEPGDYTERF